MSRAVVVPMAGRGARFLAAGFSGPKWALRPPWTNRSLLELSVAEVVESVPGAKLLLITLDVNHDSELLRNALGPTLHPAKVTALKQLQPGPLASIAAAWGSLQLGDYDELWFTTCDTYIPAFAHKAISNVAGTVICFDFDAPDLCHVDLDEGNYVLGLREKVGDLAPTSSTGTFLIKHVERFRCAMLDVLASPSVRASGEYFISDAMNLLIREGLVFDALVVPGAWTLGTPDTLKNVPHSIAGAMK